MAIYRKLVDLLLIDKIGSCPDCLIPNSSIVYRQQKVIDSAVLVRRSDAGVNGIQNNDIAICRIAILWSSQRIVSASPSLGFAAEYKHSKSGGDILKDPKLGHHLAEIHLWIYPYGLPHPE